MEIRFFRSIKGVNMGYPRKICEHCGKSIGNNAYARSHGDKCAYKDVNEGYKYCKRCGKELPLENFSKASAKTYDGLNQACKQCASIQIFICPSCGETITTSYKDSKFIVKKGNLKK